MYDYRKRVLNHQRLQITPFTVLPNTFNRMPRFNCFHILVHTGTLVDKYSSNAL